jgi:sulfite reductase (ferredoxin)
MRDIGIVGRSIGIYGVFVGGLANTRLNVAYVTSIRFEQIIPGLHPFLECWKNRRRENEPFGDFCHGTLFDSARSAPRKLR